MFTIVCLIGSTKFLALFRELEEKLSLKGYIVLSPLVYNQDGKNPKCGEEAKKILNQVQLEKIRMADIVFVLDENNYIGNSTKNQIEFAKLINKPIYYYSQNDIEKLMNISELIKN